MIMFRGQTVATVARVVAVSLLFAIASNCSSSSSSPATGADADADASTPVSSVDNTPTILPDGGTLMWVVAWGNSPENANTSTANPGGSEQTFRMLFRPTIDGTQARVRLSNAFGTTPITIGAARLASSPGDNAVVDPANDLPLTFGGAANVTIQPGQEIASDQVGVPITAGAPYAVTIYVQGTFPSLTQHASLVTTNYATPVGAGDKTADATGSAFTVTNTEWFLLSGVDVYGAYQGTVALLGSSSIDGANSDRGDTATYPTAQAGVAGQDFDRPSDWLGRQLIAAGYRLGVLNAGTLGDAAASNGNNGGIDRIQRDVLAQPNVKTVIIYLGGIDLRSGDCKNAPDVEGSLTELVAKANAAGVRVILATIPPSTYCSTTTAANYGPLPSTAAPYAGDLNPGPENAGSTQRRLVNDWIRTTATSLPGVVGIADFDKALASPDHPDFILPNLNSGDNYHPNGTGYGVQSAAIPLGAILP